MCHDQKGIECAGSAGHPSYSLHPGNPRAAHAGGIPSQAQIPPTALPLRGKGKAPTEPDESYKLDRKMSTGFRSRTRLALGFLRIRLMVLDGF